MPNWPPLPFRSDKPCLLPCATLKCRETWQPAMGALAIAAEQDKPQPCTMHPAIAQRSYKKPPPTAARPKIQLQPIPSPLPTHLFLPTSIPQQTLLKDIAFPFCCLFSPTPSAGSSSPSHRALAGWVPAVPACPRAPSPSQRAPSSCLGASTYPTVVSLRPKGAPQR